MDKACGENGRNLPEFGSAAAVRAHDGRNGGGGGQLKRIRWDRFLPKRSLRVLLVEHDDCTRHIVAALLRKCSYQVAAVADGLKAWKVMKERSFGIDIVLTEFEMPSLSGIGLLGKIVGTEECKSIPVIMMSSQDSVGIVHKCMMKGAADFLVKPLRKNELRNLWQHVWRRHCSNSYAASNQICSNADNWSQTGETSDNGSDADQMLDQKLGSKPEPETKVEIFQRQAQPVPPEHGQSPRETEAHLEQPQNNMNTIASSSLDDNVVLHDKTLVVEDVVAQPIQMALLVENTGHASHGQDDLDSLRCAKGDNEKSNLHHQINISEEPAQSLDGLVKSVANGQCSHALMENAGIDEFVSTGAARSSQMKHIFNLSTLPQGELSLMTRLNECSQQSFNQTNILHHSNASAFSRYGGSSTKSARKSKFSSLCIGNKDYADQLQTRIGCCGTNNVKCSLFASKGKGVEQSQMFSDGNMEEVGDLCSGAQPLNVCTVPSSREGTALHCQLGFLPMPIHVGAVTYNSICTGNGELFQPIIQQDSSLIGLSLAAAENGPSKIYSDCPWKQDDHFASNSGSIEFRCNDLNRPVPCKGVNTRLNDTEAGERRVLSSNPIEEADKRGNARKNILKGSGSNSSDNATTDEAVAAAIGTGPESGNESGMHNFSKNGTIPDISLREAALIKFRLKRKDRCFAKKVRYHSRQKLAEQRPRVKGQFVSRKILELNTTQEADGWF